MIVIGKDKTLDNYFIDENGVITDSNGKIQKIYLHHGRPHFKGAKVYQIQMWTNYGYRDVNFWVIHHKDGDVLNSSLTNLTYITRSEHTTFHQKGNKNLLGFHHSEEAKQKISKATKGQNNHLYGKHHSEEAKQKISKANKGRTRSEEVKRKMSETRKRCHWYNDGVKNYFCEHCPEGCIPGRKDEDIKKEKRS